jgi:hypothetical protein
VGSSPTGPTLIIPYLLGTTLEEYSGDIHDFYDACLQARQPYFIMINKGTPKPYMLVDADNKEIIRLYVRLADALKALDRKLDA